MIYDFDKKEKKKKKYLKISVYFLGPNEFSPPKQLFNKELQ